MALPHQADQMPLAPNVTCNVPEYLCRYELALVSKKSPPYGLPRHPTATSMSGDSRCMDELSALGYFAVGILGAKI
jgi:hypothetical protein